MKIKLILVLSLLFVCVSCTGLPLLPEDQTVQSEDVLLYAKQVKDESDVVKRQNEVLAETVARVSKNLENVNRQLEKVITSDIVETRQAITETKAAVTIAQHTAEAAKQAADDIPEKLDGLERGLAANQQLIESRIGELDQDGNGTVSLDEAVAAVQRTVQSQDPETVDMLSKPEFWVSIISAVILGFVALVRKKIMAAIHKYGRTVAAIQGYPSGTINGDGPVPVDKKGHPLVDPDPVERAS